MLAQLMSSGDNTKTLFNINLILKTNVMEKNEKKCQVVMLPTNDKESIIYKCKDDNTLSFKPVYQEYYKLPQHLYITSNDEIKEGDWYIDDTDAVRKSVTCDKDYWSRRTDYKKIIATTDKSLGLLDENGKYIVYTHLIPQPSESFIQKYIESYNKGEIIKDVMVEYSYKGQQYNEEDTLNSLHARVNPKDNTITIRKIKDSWNREEVVAFAYEAYKYGIQQGQTPRPTTFNKWIEENL